MSETGDPLPVRPRDGTEILYDFFKHMTSLSLITLGGVLTLSQVEKMDLKPFSLGLVVTMIAVAGISGFAGMDEVVKSRFDGQDVSRRIRFYRKLCPIAFGIGIGGFLSLFFTALY